MAGFGFVGAGGVPGIVRFLAWGYVEPEEKQTLMFCEEPDVRKANVFEGITIGPTDPPDPKWPLQFLSDFLFKLHDLHELGWIRSPKVLQKLVAVIAAAKDAVYARKMDEAVKHLDAFLAEVAAASCTTITCQENRPLTIEAYAVLFFRVEYLREHLWAQTQGAPDQRSTGATPEPPHLPNKPTPVSAETVAEKLLAELGSVPWATPYPQRHQMRPESDCRRFRGDSYVHRADEEWCHRCERQTDTQSTEWSFYAFGLQEPLACRLGQFRASTGVLPEAEREETHRILTLRLSGLYGPAATPGRHKIRERGSANWLDVRHWRTDSLELYLYIDADQRDSISVKLLARHRLLLDTLEEDKQLPGLEPTWLGHVEAMLTAKLADTLRDTFPTLLTLLAHREPVSPSPREKERRATLSRLLTEARKTSPERQAALLLAADRVASQLHPTQEEASVGEWKMQIAGYQLSYQWDKLGGVWEYGHDLLSGVWKEHGTSEWGEWAFLVLLYRGWGSPGCGGGSDQFRTVIRHAKDFLAQRPNSAIRIYVQFALAQAYETWWSLSQAGADAYVDWVVYQPGAIAARKNAITAYEQVLRLAAPTSPEAKYTRRQLPRLKLGLDTSQRRFFCIYD